MISVVGYGSLLCEQSARETMPNLQNHRLVQVPGYKRIFNKVGTVFFSRYGVANDSLEVAACATDVAPESIICCAQFEVSEADFLELYEREHRYRWVEVQTIDKDGITSTARMCTHWNDLDYRLNRCITDSEYQHRVGQFYSGTIWRDDILPFPRYLAFCLQAAERAGADVLANFMDTSFLADGITSIRQYLASHPTLSHWRQIDASYSYKTAED